MEVLWMKQHCMLIVKSLEGEDVEWVDDGIGDDDDDV